MTRKTRESVNYYTDEEIKMFEDYFVYKNDNCKVNFNRYLENYITTYGRRLTLEEAANKGVARPYTGSNILANLWYWDYSSKHILVNNQEKDNIVTYILSHPKFEPSNSRLRDLNKLCPNWNHVNKDGNNALHLLAQNCRMGYLETVVKDYGVDPNVANKNKDYFTHLLINADNFNPNSKDRVFFMTREISMLSKLSEQFYTYPLHLEKSSQIQLQKMHKELEKIDVKLRAYINDNQNINNPRILQFYEETYKPFNDTLVFHLLDKKLDDKENTIVRKNKI